MRAAFFACASNFNRVIEDGDVSLDGNPITWDLSVLNDGTFFNNVFAEVTSIVKPVVDAAAAGLVDFLQTEIGTEDIDGCGLYVIFDDPEQTTENTVFILFGGQATTGDNYAVTLAEPLEEGDIAQMGLGISFGAQNQSGKGGSHFCGCDSPMFSLIDVNGERLTSCAGNLDDGVGPVANGNLITVGGVGDSPDNPEDPFQEAADGQQPRIIDDELYDLAPFLGPQETLIFVATLNPSDDDNIFTGHIFVPSAAIIGEGITLAPLVAFNPPGTDHTVTATVVDDKGGPVPDRLVTFEVFLGPNEGEMGKDTTDENGEATFTYTGDGGTGVDEIRAFLEDGKESQESNTVLKFWDEDCNANDIPDTCDLTCGGFDRLCDDFEGCGESSDEDRDGVPDECAPEFPDCNNNGVPDDQDIEDGTSNDFNGNGIPDECEPDIDFEEPQEFPAVGEPNIEALGDLDTTDGLGPNGTIDVAITIPDAEDPNADGLVQIFLNNGDDENGQWQGLKANDAFEVGPNPSSVAVGLLNEDSHLDLVVANRGDNTISIFFNTGDGQANFVLNQVVEVGNQPSSVITGSFNEPLDTFIDIAVANELDNNITLLFNDGTGNFPTGGLGPGTHDTGGNNPFSLEPEDVDNDKCLDMVGVNNQSKGLGPSAPGNIFLLLGTGGGEFEDPITFDIGVDPRDLTVADLNRDTLPDIAAVNAADATISILINQDGRDFRLEPPIDVGLEPVSIDAADLNGNELPDLAVVAIDPVIGPVVQVLKNLFDGETLAFGEPESFGVEADPNFVANGPMNDDDIFDVVTVNRDEDPAAGPGGSVSVLLSSPTPISFQARLDIKPGGCPNSFNRKSNGKLPIALLGTKDFDAAQVDLTTLLLSRAIDVGGSVPPIEGPPGPHSVLADVATPFEGEPCDCHDLDEDGTIDLSMKFSSQEVVTELELNDLPGGAFVELVLSGNLLDGTPFEASDCIRLVPPVDLDDDGMVGTNDLLILLAAWGPCPPAESCPADLNLDDRVGIGDLIILLSNWGKGGA